MFRMLLGVVFLCVVGPGEEEGVAVPKPDLPTAAVCINDSIRAGGGAPTARNNIQLGEFVMIQPRDGFAKRFILLRAVALSGLGIGVYSGAKNIANPNAAEDKYNLLYSIRSFRLIP